jgi:hypothetical protein
MIHAPPAQQSLLQKDPLFFCCPLGLKILGARIHRKKTIPLHSREMGPLLPVSTAAFFLPRFGQ